MTFRDKGQPVFLTVPSPVGAQARGAAQPRGVEEPEHSQKEIDPKRRWPQAKRRDFTVIKLRRVRSTGCLGLNPSSDTCQLG